MRMMTLSSLLLLGAIIAQAGPLQTDETPVVLLDDVAFAWGGHTFGYMVEGERGIFTCAARYTPEDLAKRTPESKYAPKLAVLGQHPKPGSDLVHAEKVISFDRPGIELITPPQMVRTPDGYLHIFIGQYGPLEGEGPWGMMAYFRSKNPEDVREWVDLTANLPANTPPFSFHLRTNIGLSRDGNTLVWTILAGHRDKEYFNTPYIFFGRRSGLDFVFDPPVVFPEDIGMFYPQVAVTDYGIVFVAENWDGYYLDPEKRMATRIIHLDEHGKELHRVDLSEKNPGGGNFIYDVRPKAPDDWSHLIMVAADFPAENTGLHGTTFQFFEYDLKNRKLSQVNSFKPDGDESLRGRWLRINSQRSLLLTDPRSGPIRAWTGDILNGAPLEELPMPHINASALGYHWQMYLFVPNPIYGSVPSPGAFSLGMYVVNSSETSIKGHPDPGSFLLWRVTGDDFDQDFDGLPDEWETTHRLNFYSAAGADGPDGDPDGDGSSNRDELASGSNPTALDTAP